MKRLRIPREHDKLKQVLLQNLCLWAKERNEGMSGLILRGLPMCLSQLVKFALVVATVGPLCFFIGQMLPRKNFRYDVFPFKCYKWERGGEVYTKLRIQYWKDRVPDMSQYIKSMYAKRITVFKDVKYLKQLVVETCIAELIHVALIFVSPIFLLFMDGAWGVGGMICYILGNLPFIMIQRYNRPRLLMLIERQEMLAKKRAERAAKQKEGATNE